MVELALRVHSPGPCTGTSATLKAELSEPLSTPLETIAMGPRAEVLAFDPVTSANFVLLTVDVGLGFGADLFAGVVVVVVAIMVVVVLVAVVGVRVVDVFALVA
jgi:hypothetical protein